MILKVALSLLLVLSIYPLIRLFFIKGFLLRVSLFPKALLIMMVAFIGYVLSGILLLQYAENIIIIVVILLFIPCIFYVYFWRARPHYGSGRKLPPGSLQLAQVGPWVDYRYYLTQAEKYGAIAKMSHYLRPMICLTGFDIAKEFLQQYDDVLSTPPMPFNRYVSGGFMRYMQEQNHARFRATLKSILSSKAMLDLNDEYMDAKIKQTIGQMLDAKEVNPADYFKDMTFALLAKLFIGITEQDEESRHLKALYRVIDYRRALFTSRAEIEKSLEACEAIFLLQVERQRECFVTEFFRQADSNNQDWNEQAVLRNFIYLLLTSSIDIADLLCWIFKKLSDHPGYISRAKETLDHDNGDGIRFIQHIVLETLRLEQSEYLMRMALDNIEFHGFTIPRGWLIRIGVRESHLDKRFFAHADRFDPDRFLQQTEHYYPLGIGNKSCLGRGITLWLGQKLISALVRQSHWHTIADGPRELGVFHWQPSRRFIALMIEPKECPQS